MRAKPELKFDPAAVSELACPACRGDLRADSAPARLICSACGRAYPIVDGIPVLIVERAESSSKSEKPAQGE
jgi:uncharacterized protein YbaR (Trm112 family)